MSKPDVYNEVNMYTKYKLIEMLVKKHKDKFDGLDEIEELADDMLKLLALCGLKYYNKLKGKFDEE
mgnify:CR=1 FL=1